MGEGKWQMTDGRCNSSSLLSPIFYLPLYLSVSLRRLALRGDGPDRKRKRRDLLQQCIEVLSTHEQNFGIGRRHAHGRRARSGAEQSQFAEDIGLAQFGDSLPSCSDEQMAGEENIQA